MTGEYTQGLKPLEPQEPGHGRSGQLGKSVSGRADASVCKKRGRESEALSLNLPRKQHRTPDVAVSRKEAEEAAEYVNFLSSLPHLTSVVKENRRPLLPPQQPSATKKTLVLDLDHTLIRSTQHSFNKAKGNKEVFVTTDGSCTAFQRRPFLKDFLEAVCPLFEVAVFTAGSRSYAEPLLEILDPERRYFSHRLYRDSCLRVPSRARPGMAFLMKDLTSLGRPLHSLLIIDNTPTVFGYQINNGIPIVSWYDDMCDRELVNILPFLKDLAGVKDVRPHIAQHSSLHRMVDEAFAKFPAAFPCAMPAPPAQSEPTTPGYCGPPGLNILADACMGLGCDEQLEPPADKSPFKPLEPLTELPDPALNPNSPDLLHLSGQRRAQASTPAYPSAALAQRILGERSTAPTPAGLPAEIQGHMQPHMGAPDGEIKAAVAPVELLCAEADQALQQLQGYDSSAPSWTSSSEDSAGSAQERGDAKSSPDSGRRVLGEPLDEQSMWVDEQIAEAELLRQLEDSDSPVEPTAQLSLPMFPDLAHLDSRPDAGQHSVSSTLPDSWSGSKEEDASREAMSGTVGCLGSPWAAAGGTQGSLSSAASMPDLEENFVTPVGSPRKQAASAPPVLDLRFARSDSLVSAASQPSCRAGKHLLPCSSSGQCLPSSLSGVLPSARGEQSGGMQLKGLGSFALHCFLASSDEGEQPKMKPRLRSPQLLCA